MAFTDILNQFNNIMNLFPGENVFGELFKKELLNIIKFTLETSVHSSSVIDLNTVELLILTIIYTLSTDDVALSVPLINICDKLEHLKSKYLSVWLSEDCSFEKDTVVRCFEAFGKLVSQELIEPNQDLTVVLSALYQKYIGTSQDSPEGCPFLEVPLNVEETVDDKLCKAAASNNVAELIFLASRGGNINLKTSSGESLYHLAVTETCTDAIMVLSFLKADIETRNNKWVTPLLKAVLSGKFKAVEALLLAGASVDQWFKGGNHILHIASSLGNTEVMQVLLKFIKEVKIKNQRNETPLIIAIKKNYTNSALLLLKYGANANDNYKGESVLHLACRMNNDIIVKELIKNNATTESVNSVGLMPIHLTNDAKVIKALKSGGVSLDLKTTASESALNWAIINGYYEAVIALINLGANIQFSNDKAETPLLLAVKHKRYELVDLLLNSGADPNAKNKDDMSAAIFATEQGALTTLQMLEVAGANLKVKNKTYNLLHTAVSFGHQDIVDFLLNCEGNYFLGECCDVRDWKYFHNSDNTNSISPSVCVIQSPTGLTALHLACFKGHHSVVMSLLQANAPINAEDCNKWTPLQFAVDGGHTSIVKLLLSKGAEISKKNKINQTVCHIAATRGHLDIIRILVEERANLNESGFRGWTPMHYAAANGHLSILEYLLERNARIDSLSEHNHSPLDVSANDSISDFLRSRA